MGSASLVGSVELNVTGSPPLDRCSRISRVFGGGEVGVVVRADLHHGRLDASAEALDLGERKHVLGGFSRRGDAGEIFHFLHDAVGPRNHAGAVGADLNVEFADGLEVEHGVEGGDFVHANVGEIEGVGHQLHGIDRQPAAAFALGEVKQRNGGATLAVGRVFGQCARDGLLLLLGPGGSGRGAPTFGPVVC